GEGGRLLRPRAGLGGPPLVALGGALPGGRAAAAAGAAAGGWRLRPAGRAGAAGGLFVAAGLVLVSGYAVPLPQPAGPPVTVAFVQGNVPRLGLDFNAQRRAVLDNHVQATRALAREVAAGRQPQPDFVVWPENSSDIDPLRNADAREQIQAAA